VTDRRAVSPATALLVAATGIGLFSIMDAFMKTLVLAIGVYNAMFWRSLLNVGLGAAAWWWDARGRPSARAVRLHLARGGVTTAMALLFFWGLARVPMAQAIALTYIAPILALLLAAWLLGERVGRHVALASVAAFAGVLVVVMGQSHGAGVTGDRWGVAAILASAILYAVNLVIARVQAQAARPGEIAFFQSGVTALLLALATPWWADLPDAATWGQLAIAAGLSTASLLLLAWAYAHGDTGFLATSEYSSFVYAALLGWLVFGERVLGWTLAGAAIIVAACLYAARRRDRSADIGIVAAT
jgi:S-adenosylmethionine uptake transporter